MISKDHDRLKIAQEYMREHLPFYLNADFSACYAHKLYEWQQSFLLCKNTLAFLTAANQIGKSSGQIIKCINMATRQDLWAYWFPRRKPKTFVYCYPSSSLCALELDEKWIKDYLPRGEMKKDPRYGWELHKDSKGQPEKITFNSGVTVYFRFYSQAPKTLQAATVDCVFLDEETPEAHYDELQVRTQAAAAQGSGYCSMVFTATLGQPYLYNCMERQGTALETFKGAWKRQVSVFDCLQYADGTPSEIWNRDYIENVLKPKYRNKREQDRRLYGRFVKDTGLLFEEFEVSRNTEPPGTTSTKGWRNYIGVDYGAGGDYGHSSAIVLVKVDPTYSKARVTKVWTSQKRRMTQSDLLLAFKDFVTGLEGSYQAFADWGAVDLFTLAAREGVILHKAEKSHEIGIPLLNTLFKGAQLIIETASSSMSQFLVSELQSISEDKKKNHRVDDIADALRYAISLCPMRITALKIAEEKKRFDVSKMNPREAFYKGLDRKGDPLIEPDDDFGMDLSDAIEEFEGLL